jgi:small subunit ribosomal protein S11
MTKLNNKKSNIKQKKFKIVFRPTNNGVIRLFKKKDFKRKLFVPAVILPVYIQGIFHVKCSFNNTLVALTDSSGKIRMKSSCGIVGFKGSKRSSKFAAQIAIEELSKQAKNLGYIDITLHLSGLGRARKICLKSIQKFGLYIHFIKENSPISYNGCRPSKIRRL